MEVSRRTKRRWRSVAASKLISSVNITNPDLDVSTLACSANQITETSESELIVYSDSEFLPISPILRSDSSSSDESSNINTLPLKDRIATWAANHNITHQALNDLLNILRDEGCQLPKDSRTVMHTPTSCNLIDVGGGKFFYFGIQEHLVRLIDNSLYNFNDDKTIKLDISVDGVPISNSSTKQFWPIYGMISGHKLKLPFLIALFCGDSKPKNLDEYLNAFITEVSELQSSIMISNQCYKVIINAFIADAPARSFLKCCKSHNAYSGCEKCVCHGLWDGRVTFTDLNAVVRTDNDFKDQVDENHHTGISPLNKLDVGLVSQFPIDYMHLVCLGVMRKLLNTWIKLKSPQRLQLRLIEELNCRMVASSKYVCAEFARKPRSLKEIDNFKATEFRTILLYVGPIILKGILSKQLYSHFLLFHCAIRILSSNNAASVEWNQLAKSLLHTFVSKSAELYGNQFLVYNVHSLIHLADDCLKYGKLDNFSAFPFENEMQRLKRLLRNKKLSLQQVVNRVSERNSMSVNNNLLPRKLVYDKLYNYKNSDRLNYKGFLFCPNSMSDSCFMTNDKQFILIQSIHKDESSYSFQCNWLNTENISEYPIPSTRIGIGLVSQSAFSRQVKIKAENIVCKCLLIPYFDNVNLSLCIPFNEMID